MGMPETGTRGRRSHSGQMLVVTSGQVRMCHRVCFATPTKKGAVILWGRYSDIYPMARVGRGQQLVWQWPAKNHADVGTQRMVQLFISKGPGLGDDFSHITSKADWVQRYPKLQQTFSNCFVDGNRVGSGVDKAVCSGTFTVPNHLPLGIYTFMWWWEFNGGEFYNSCADVLITNVDTTYWSAAHHRCAHNRTTHELQWCLGPVRRQWMGRSHL